MFACVIVFNHAQKNHLIAVKRNIIYLKGAINMGLWHPRTGQFTMTSYSDADYACFRVIERVQGEYVNFSIIVLFHDPLRNKIQ